MSIAEALQAAAAKKAAAAPAPEPVKAKGRDDLVWDTMDATTLGPEMTALFQTILQAQEAERKAKKALSDALGELLDLPPHLMVRVGTKWSRLSVAIDKREASGGISLSALVAKANAILAAKK